MARSLLPYVIQCPTVKKKYDANSAKLKISGWHDPPQTTSDLDTFQLCFGVSNHGRSSSSDRRPSWLLAD